MIAVPAGSDMRMAVVTSPQYFKENTKPGTLQDLTGHACINMRLPTHDMIYQWKFEKNTRSLKVRVDGPAVFNTLTLRLNAALEGFGLAYIPQDYALPKAGKPILVLDDWCETFPGYHLYYPSRRQATPAFALVLEALRCRH